MPDTSRTSASRLFSLLSEWDARRASGEVVAPADLCPADLTLQRQLADHIAAVLAVERQRGRLGPEATDGGGDEETAPVHGFPSPPGLQLHEEIGRGGMGVVFRAVDREFGRPLAVKVMRPGLPEGRFLAEADIMARLQHPGVPPVFARGRLPGGQPYFAMKLVAGRSLHEALAARPSPQDDVPRLLAVFEQVCQAVGYAHGQGVVHRDLKPHNVMTGAFGEVQLMDWGLARDAGRGGDESPLADAAAPEAGETDPGTVLGTPGYMAPEQARGEVADARSDVFALGGILTAILTGHPPFVADNAAETVRRAAAADLTDALTRLDACGADPELTAVAKRCLSAEPAARYAYGRAVAEAVTAYRAGVEERVRRAEAERAAAEAEVREQRKRQRLWYALALALVCGLAASCSFAVWANVEAGRSQAQQVVTVAALSAAESAHDRNVRALRKLSDEVVGEQAGRRSALTDRERRYFREVERLWQELASGRERSEDGVALAAEGSYRVGLIRYRLGDLAEAERGFQAAIEGWERLAAGTPTGVEHRLAVGKAKRELALVLSKAGKTLGAEAALTSSLNTLRALVQGEPENTNHLEELAKTHNNYANLLYETDRFTLAETECRDSVIIWKKLIDTRPGTSDYLNGVGIAHNNLGRLSNESNRLADAERNYRDAVDVYRTLTGSHPEEPDYQDHLAGAQMNLGIVLARAGQPADAEPAFRAALSGQIRLASAHPSIPEYGDAAGLAGLNLSEFLLDAGRATDAEAVLFECLATYTKLSATYDTVPDYPSGKAETLIVLAIAYNSQLKFAEAVVKLAEARGHNDKAIRLGGSKSFFRRSLQRNLRTDCNARVGLRDHAAAATSAEELLKTGAEPSGDVYDAATVYASCAEIATSSGHTDLARRYATRAAELIRQAVRVGWKDYQRLQSDPEWRPVRNYPEIGPLLLELAKAGPVGPPPEK